MHPPTFLAPVSHEEAARAAGNLLARAIKPLTGGLVLPTTEVLKATEPPTEVPALLTTHHPDAEVAIPLVMLAAATWARARQGTVKAEALPPERTGSVLAAASSQLQPTVSSPKATTKEALRRGNRSQGQGAQTGVFQCAPPGPAVRCGLTMAVEAAVLHAHQMGGRGEPDPATRSLCNQRGEGDFALCIYAET